MTWPEAIVLCVSIVASVSIVCVWIFLKDDKK